MNNESTKTSRFSGRTRLGLAAAGLILAGGTAGAIAVSATRPSIEMAPLNPVAIHALTDGGSVITIKGRVLETYGNKFVIADASGKTLVDTGRAGEDGPLVSGGQAVTVQGRFEHGFVQGSYLIGPDGKVTSLRPMGPPHGLHEKGPRGENLRRDADMPVPPVPPVGDSSVPAQTPPPKR